MRVEPQGDGGLLAGRALVPVQQPAAERAPFPWPSLPATLLIATFGLATGLGAAGAYGMRHVLFAPRAAPAASATMVRQLQDQVVRLQGSVEAVRTASDNSRAEDQMKAMRRSVDALKQEVDQVRANGSASAAQIASRIDKADHDPSAKLADISARLDRMEHDAGKPAADTQQNTRLSELASRMERLEKQAASPATTGSIPPVRAPQAMIGPVKPPATLPMMPQAKAEAPRPPAPGPVATPAVAKPAAVKTGAVAPTVSGWVLRDVYDGTALVEARGGGLREVEPGAYLPGAGEVRSIERHGADWVVVTSRGMIGNETF